MTLSERIKEAMEQTGIDALDLAMRLRKEGQDVSYNTAYQWHSGRRTPRAEMVPFIAKALGVTPNELFGVEPASRG